MEQYLRYINTIGDVVKSDFKSNPSFRICLEHLSTHHGRIYLDKLLSFGMSIDDIQLFCRLNDKIGKPIMSKYDELECSSTSLRYLYHAYIILQYCSQDLKKDKLSIVELGGSYGGLALAINFLSLDFNIKIEKYIMYELNTVSTLMKKYLSLHKLNFPVIYPQKMDYGASLTENDYFLISSYGFCEFEPDEQKVYLDHLFPKVSHGFMAWNQDYFDFGKPIFKTLDDPIQGSVKNKDYLF